MHLYKSARIEKKMIGGRWTNKDEVVHINKTERLAIFFGINFFFKKFSSKYICFKTDNTTVVSFINAMGCMQSKQSYKLTVDKWNWCFQRN